jgi:CRISPR-associated protein Cmr2
MNEHYFHFTLGPVQGFVAQARRTRDFWAGSFLLSWLSAVAMGAVEHQKGKVIFPSVDEDFLMWVKDGKGKKSAPQQGCIPNRFKGGLAKVPDDFKPELVEQAINTAWQALANEVWKRDLSHCNADTRAIWKRQVENFWEISWALTDDKKQSNLLDRRKNWRTYLPPEEAGVKCMMMDGWQELSGTKSPNAKDLNIFWEKLRNQKDSTLKTDLREHEYLCAIAFIKRRFARCFLAVEASMSDGWTAHGWTVNASVPSVVYMAAAPWLAKVLEFAPDPALKNFHDAAKALTKGYDEYETRLKCIKEALNKRQDNAIAWYLKSLDGNVFFDAALDNKNLYPEELHEQAKKVKSALKDLRLSVKEKIPEPPSPFYAVLMMDGDSLGTQMSDLDKQKPISDSLNYFTKGVADVVKENSGFLIYAGGDDVLALLPLEHALNCANALRKLYEEAFSKHGKGLVSSTLSGAIEYAHIKMPLGKVLGDAHHLLDDVAKDQCGRNAIAVRVWKPGGRHLQWAMPWTKAVQQAEAVATEISEDKPLQFVIKPGEVIIDCLALDFQNRDQESQFSNKFFFNINERFAMLQSKNEQGEMETNFAPQDIVQLIAAEYLSSGLNVKREPKITLNVAKQRIAPLIEQCFPKKRTLKKNGEESFSEAKVLNTDAMQFIRFLAQKGVDRG